MSNAYAHTDASKRPGPLQKAAHALTLLPLAALWAKLALRVGSTYGPAGILLSPAVGWLPIGAYLWLQEAMRQG